MNSDLAELNPRVTRRLLQPPSKVIRKAPADDKLESIRAIKTAYEYDGLSQAALRTIARPEHVGMKIDWTTLA